MLMMRRHEKDFITRLDPRYADQVKAELPGFVAALEAVAAQPEVKRDIAANMTAYQDIFARFVAGMVREQAANNLLNVTAREVEPRLARLDDTFIAQGKTAQKEGDATAAFTRRLVLLSIGGIVVVVGCLCWLIGRGIARPIIAVTRAMQALAQGRSGRVHTHRSSPRRDWHDGADRAGLQGKSRPWGTAS
jgi:methyl-accepting chemotaxis protein